MPDPYENPNPFAAPKAEVSQSQRKERPPLASLGQRLAGYLFDQLIHSAAVLLWLLATGDLGTFVEIAGQTDDSGMDSMMTQMSQGGIVGVGVISTVFVVIQFYLIFSARQTIGKRIVGTRIHRMSGEWANPWRIVLLRGLVPLILYAIPVIGWLIFLVGHLMIFGRERRCLHDLIADTVVLEA